MSEPQPVAKDKLMGSLPPLWSEASFREQIAQSIAETNRCVVALDDDPTGTQTVHGIWVVTGWDVATLTAALADGDPALYILTNTRSMPLAEAKAVNGQVARNLVAAARSTGRSITVVSRSDSTLRGHYPGEVDALDQALASAQGLPFDGVCLIPFLAEGGRFTINDVHWVQDGEMLVPAAQSPYARDSVFGYMHSRLPDWVEEKTGGKVAARHVVSISLETIRRSGPAGVADCLGKVRAGQVVVVNAADIRDLEVFVAGLQEAEAEGKRFLFRTAAAFVKVAAGLSDQPLLVASRLVARRPPGGGLIVFGSHVPVSKAQLAAVRAIEGVDAIELPVLPILDDLSRESTIARVSAELEVALARGHEGLVYTSREFVTGSGQATSLSIGKSVSHALADVVRRLRREPRYVVGKGGITSSDLATQGMHVLRARVLGQVLPGVPVWELGPESRWPGMPFIVFPGNVGEAESVAEIVRTLSA